MCWPKKNFDDFELAADGKTLKRIGNKLTGCYNGICIGADDCKCNQGWEGK